MHDTSNHHIFITSSGNLNMITLFRIRPNACVKTAGLKVLHMWPKTKPFQRSHTKCQKHKETFNLSPFSELLHMEECQNTPVKLSVEEHFCCFLTNLLDCTSAAKVNMSYTNPGQEMTRALGKNTSGSSVTLLESQWTVWHISVFTLSVVTVRII